MDPIDESDNPLSDRTSQAPSESPLYQRAVMGGLWVAALNWATKLLGLISLFVLTNLLGSAKWGLLGIASLVISTLTVFTQTGFSTALIQKRDNTRDYLDTAWSIELIRGICLCLVLWVAAPWAAFFFDQDGTVLPSHVEKPAVFLQTLQEDKKPISVFIHSHLSPDLRNLAESTRTDSSRSSEIKRQISEDLNRLLAGNGWEASGLLTGVTLSPYTRKLMTQPSVDPIRLHRRMLQDAYPRLITETVLDRDTILWIIRLLSLIQVIGALINIGTLYFKKDMQFHRDFAFTVVSYLAETIVTVILAIGTRSVWSLVWGKLLGVILKCIFSYWVHPYRPRFRLDRAKAWDLWTFGQWIFFAGILSFFLSRGDQLLVGKLLGPAMLGLYVLANKLSHVPATEITTVIAEVTFPAYSKIQNDLPRLRNAYFKVLRLTAFFSVPVAGLVFALSADFVHTFFREEWWTMIPVLQILVFRGLVNSIHATFGSVFQAVGKPFIPVFLQIVRLFLMAALLYPLIVRWQIRGAAAAIVLIALIMQPFGYWMIIRILRCTLRSILRELWIPFTATVGMVLAVYGLRRLACDGYYNIWTLGGLGAAGVSVYLLLMLAFEWMGLCQNRPLLTEIVQTVLRKRSSHPAELQPIPPIDEP
jgi:O-antigen/teichoic acid export membrane protein